MNTIALAILDVDGTLIDSNDAHARAWIEAFAEYGFRVEFDKVRPLIGMGGDNLMPLAIGMQSSSDLGEKIEERRGEIFKQKYLPALKPFPKARELLVLMRDEGLELVVASSSSKEGLKDLLLKSDISDLIKEKTSADDAVNSKPDPDIVKAVLQKSGYTAEQAVMLGDTPYDIAAAAQSKVPCVALRCGGWQDQDLSGATEIYDDPQDLLHKYHQSVFFRGRKNFSLSV